MSHDSKYIPYMVQEKSSEATLDFSISSAALKALAEAEGARIKQVDGAQEAGAEVNNKVQDSIVSCVAQHVCLRSVCWATQMKRTKK
jgi:hypothetical protein